MNNKKNPLQDNETEYTRNIFLYQYNFKVQVINK